MKVLVVEPGYAPYEKDIEGLEAMQEVVGGLITASYPYEDLVAVVSNDESILLGIKSEPLTHFAERSFATKAPMRCGISLKNPSTKLKCPCCPDKIRMRCPAPTNTIFSLLCFSLAT